MLIANVLMDENEGLYINLAEIKNRIHNIEEKLNPPVETTYSAELVNEIDIGEKATFKAWTACYYKNEEKVVGKNSTIRIRPEFDFIATGYGISSINAFTTDNTWTDSNLRYDENLNIHIADGDIHTNGILFNYTSTATTMDDVLDNATKDVVIWSEGWLSAYTYKIESTCKNTFYPWSKFEDNIYDTVYTRILNQDITFYTLNEANSGSTDMSYYLTPETLSTSNYALIDADISTVPFSCTLKDITPSKDFSNLKAQWSNYLTPNKLSAIKENTIYTPCIANKTDFSTMIGGVEQLCAVAECGIFYTDLVHYDNTWYMLKNIYHPTDKPKVDGYLVEPFTYGSGTVGYKYKEAFPDSGLNKYTSSSIDMLFNTYNISEFLTYKAKNNSYSCYSSEESDFQRSLEHFILEQNKYVYKDEFDEYVSTLSSSNPVAFSESKPDRVSKERDSKSVAIAKANNTEWTTLVLANDLQYKGLSDSYTYQNYTFKDLSIRSPVPIYMKGTDGKMYLIAMKRTHSNGYDDDGNMIIDHIYYGPYYGTIAHSKASFTPFDTYYRYDEDKTIGKLGSTGGFIRNSALDTTTTLEGVVVATEETGNSFKSYYAVTFGTFTKPATKNTVATVIPSITTSELK